MTENEIPQKALRTKQGKLSKFLCMIAATLIAFVPESNWSIIFWVIYVGGAIFGIIHLTIVKDPDTRQTYMFWLFLDVVAIIRLIIL